MKYPRKLEMTKRRDSAIHRGIDEDIVHYCQIEFDFSMASMTLEFPPLTKE